MRKIGKKKNSNALIRSYCYLLPLLLLACIPMLASGQQVGIVKGRVTNVEFRPIPYTNILVKGKSVGVATGADGTYSINLPLQDTSYLVYTSIGYMPDTIRVVFNSQSRLSVDVILKSRLSYIDEVSVIASNRRYGNIERLNPRDIQFLPDASGSFEAILKSLPGVSSTHEMSSQYSVRGGNFDENLVYVNDIEVYRPFLVRSGQQEGLSFINSDMVEGVEFSAGGFNAEYGDKMSSVLNIRYRTPSRNAARADISALGANGLIEGTSSSGRFSHLTGFRYKTSEYMLNSLDVGGDYRPSFYDFQSNLSWRVSPKFKVSILGNISSNRYHFTPGVRETRFGSFTNALQLKVFYEGQEVNRFETIQGAVTGEVRPAENVTLKFIGASYVANETESFDIFGRYLLNELDNTLGSDTYADSTINVGIGGFLNHARNNLNASFLRGEHLGTHTTEANSLKWGIRYQHERITDRISEWDMVDSSGYSLPYNTNEVVLPYFLKSNNTINSSRISGYVQDSYRFSIRQWEVTATAGFRFSYWSFNGELTASPRGTIMVKPNWERDIAFHISGGYYHQPPLYKEYRMTNGELNRHIMAQKSVHAVFGAEYLFRAWSRPFRFQAELYHKELSNLVPYKIDNVRIIYSGENLARGYAQGIDLKINGEFVVGAESWASISFMRTYEDISNDSFVNETGITINPGYYPRPTDQRFSIGAFFQDYMPGNPTYRVHLTGFYGTGLPVSIPNIERYDITTRMPSYKRVDIGFTKVFKDNNGKGGKAFAQTTWLKGLWLGVEVFNLFDFKNTISYLWVQTVANQNNVSGKYAVPNYLTSRRINVKLSAKF